MKTKETVEEKFHAIEKLNTKTKPKSLRPMRSLVAVRSFRPKTTVAVMVKAEELSQRN